MQYTFDRRKTLQELEGVDWGEPQYGSYLITTTHRLRRKPLQDISAEDLRLLIGQGVGLSYLLPLALEHLEQNPLAEGDYYPGDLLRAVLGTPPSLWFQDRTALSRIEGVLAKVGCVLTGLGDSTREVLSQAIAAFRQNTQAR